MSIVEAGSTKPKVTASVIAFWSTARLMARRTRTSLTSSLSILKPMK